MKLRRSKQSGYIYAEFTTPDGTRRVTTKTKSMDQARGVARTKRFREIEQAAKADALTSEVIMRLTAGRRVTVLEAIGEYVESMRINRAKELTIATLDYKIRAWAREQRLEKRMISDVDRRHVDAFINEPSQLTLSTRRGRLGFLRGLMAFCVARGWRSDNPASECRVVVDDIPHSLQVPKERRTFTDDDVKKLLEATASDPFWHSAIQLSYHQGLRLSDIATLEWDSYNKAKGRMSVVMNKVDRPITFDLDAAVKRIMDAIPKEGNRYVWPAQAATWIDPKSTSNLSQQFRRICQRVGIEGSFHGLRHSFAQRRLEVLKTEERQQWLERFFKEQATKQVSAELGHKSTKTTQIYLNHP